jgi:hypothetical protein
VTTEKVEFEEVARWTHAYLNQGEVWFPKGRGAVAISSMDIEWRFNASRWLERTAATLEYRYTFGEIYELSRPMWRESHGPDASGVDLFASTVLSTLDLMSDAATDGMEEAQEWRRRDPAAWIRHTRLYKALTADLPTDVGGGIEAVARRAAHWSTCPAWIDPANGTCRCAEIRSAHEAAEAARPS